MILIKIGGSVITKKLGYMEISEDTISKIARAIANQWKKGHRKIAIIHGAGSYGHAPILKHGLGSSVKNEADRVAFAEVHAACTDLSMFLVWELVREGVPAVSVSPFTIAAQSNGKLTKFDDRIVTDLVKKGYLPVVHEDMMLDARLGGAMCAADSLMFKLAKHAKKVIYATTIDNLIVNGKTVHKVTRKDFKTLGPAIRGSESDIRGGIAGRLEELLQLKVPSYMINGVKVERIEDIIEGKKTVCLEIKP
ncbi:MAG: isopentenyl phosphate kinase [Candidatus Bilamarchaeaceae archaeon]